MSHKVSIIVPNWNGKAFLSRCVGGLLQSAAEAGLPYELLLLDDASTDGSAEETAREFPDVRLIIQEKNLGFGATVNRGAREASGDILILANNDLVPKADFIGNLVRHFDEADDIFGVSGKTVDWEASAPNHVNMTAEFSAGRFRLKWSDDAETAETMFMQGGSCAIRRDLFLKFGGLFHLYAPAYWEDYDLCYQALKAGYRNIYEPTAVASHLGQGSMIRAYGEERVNLFKLRNLLLFHAVNLSDDDLYSEFWQGLPNFVRSGNEGRFKARLEAFAYLVKNASIIREERRRRKTISVVSDRSILERFSMQGTLC